MIHSLAKFVFILVLAKIDRLETRAVEVIYTGEGCECGKNLPYQINIPVVPEPLPLDCPSYGYTIEKPALPKAQYAYSFDFVVDQPVVPTPPPIPKANLFAIVDRVVMPKPDCVLPAAAPCGLPAPEPLPLAPPPPPPPPAAVNPCLCGQCAPPLPLLKPACRYVLNKLQTNHIARTGGRAKRDISTMTQNHMSELRDYVKSKKAARVERKARKSKIVKRDIKGEYDLLQKDQAAMDLTIPEIIQYMPETLMPNFKRGKCNIGGRNCIKKQKKGRENKSSTPNSTSSSDTNPPQQQPQQQPEQRPTTETTPTLPNQQYLTPQYDGASYLKRSVNPYQQYPCPCYPALMPPPYVPNPSHIATFAQNPVNPIWSQSQSQSDTNSQYVYDRLGHKYEVKNGSLKLLTPQMVDEVNVSAPAIPSDENVQSAAIPITPPETEIALPIVAEQKMPPQAPVVGAPAHQNPSYDPQMDKVIRDIIYQHPDFVDATEHAPGSLTQPLNVQQDETMQFLGKLIRGRLNNWFGVNEEAPKQNLDELNRYSRETGTSIKFIPVVTVDKDKLNKYRQDMAQATK